MANRDANPHFVDDKGNTQYKLNSLQHLEKVERLTKSVYFTIKEMDREDGSRFVVGEPWKYKNGIYPATYIKVIGGGGEGTVLGAELKKCGTKVALKFVKVGALKHTKGVDDGLADLDTRLGEMTAMNAVKGSCVLEVFGHYRLV